MFPSPASGHYSSIYFSFFVLLISMQLKQGPLYIILHLMATSYKIINECEQAVSCLSLNFCYTNKEHFLRGELSRMILKIEA